MICNQRGSVINVALLILMLLTLLGISFANLSSTDIKIAGNDRTQNLAFYSAEAARGYVAATPSLYGSTNVTTTEPLSFPDLTDTTLVANIATALGTKQSFSGTVTYQGRGNPPRESGYASPPFMAHRYQMLCNGTGPSNANSELEAGFYRIGF